MAATQIVRPRKTLVKRKPKEVPTTNKIIPKHLLRERILEKLIDQDAAVDAVIPYITMYLAGFHTESRPIGSLFMLGGTGCGKTRLVEVLADVLHKDEKRLVRIDCGQYEQSHEVAKLIGSPPGYLGHRETPPLLNQLKINAVKSEECDISLVLFDEIEKAHPSFSKVLLSIMDKGELTTGDNSKVDFTKALVFYTSNLGATDIQALTSGFSLGFASKTNSDENVLTKKITSVGLGAVKKKFTPEFFNRLDEVVTFKSLSPEAIKKIFDLGLDKIRETLYHRTRPRESFLVVSPEAEEYLLKAGFSPVYGARELNRVLRKQLLQPLADLFVEGRLGGESVVRVDFIDGKLEFNVFDKQVLEKSLAK